MSEIFFMVVRGVVQLSFMDVHEIVQKVIHYGGWTTELRSSCTKFRLHMSWHLHSIYLLAT
jgi:hypothetical protein